MEMEALKPVQQKKNKPKRIARPVKILTNYIISKPEAVVDLLVYDIPAKWTHEQILSHLILWGNTISLLTRIQRKYQSVRIKIELNDFTYPKYRRGDWTIDLGGIPVRWFPAEWSIKDRKQHESFTAVLKDIPDSLTVQSIWQQGKLHELFESVHAFKIIQEGKERRLIGYFKTWQDYKVIIGSSIV
jgi:hypothetical protein